jgi:hypothetical protein
LRIWTGGRGGTQASAETESRQELSVTRPRMDGIPRAYLELVPWAKFALLT